MKTLMKTKEIESFMRRFSDAQKLPFIGEDGKTKEQEKAIIALQKELCIAIPLDQNNLWHRIQGVKDHLSLNMMLNACVSAKWSCLFAAIAATAACISTILAMVTVLGN